MSDTTRSLSRFIGAPTRPEDLDPDRVSAIALLWSRDEPRRVGEVAAVPGGYALAQVVLGRSDDPNVLGGPPVLFGRQRPGDTRPTGPLRSKRISRAHLAFSTDDDGVLSVRRLGRAPLLVDGERCEECQPRLGQLIEIEQRVVFLCTQRPPTLPDPPYAASLPRVHFGEPDPWGIVGESPAAWALRGRIAFVSGRNGHVLVRGPSGSGKELVARALHGSSGRSRGPFVSRNAATIPESLVDAELFGNARNYPNPGMAERKGLIGEADGGTLFLDEFAELREEAQAHLLRVLDDGEYHRLGEGRPRQADLRLVAATNRALEALKHDVLARLELRIEVSGLEERREDVPLLVNHLLRQIADEDPAVGARFFEDGKTDGTPRTSPALISALVRSHWHTNVRELKHLLWEAIAHTQSDTVSLWSGLQERPAPPQRTPQEPALVALANRNTRRGDAADPDSLDPEYIQQVLDEHNGAQEPTWRALNLSSRHALARLVKKHGLSVRGRSR